MFSIKNLSLIAALATLTGIVIGVINVSMALAIGIVLALSLGNPVRTHTSKFSGFLLKTAVVGLGFGLPIDVVLTTAKDSFWVTVLTLSLAIGLGALLTRVLKLETKTGTLLSVGTAICGGSAIAAVGPVIKANQEQMAIALAIVFILNGVGLIVFPWIGHWFQLDGAQFGLWAALAIHDTSSVVGAAADYGQGALAVATTAKLARAIWIIPLVIIMGLMRKEAEQKATVPLFIALFLLASVLTTVLPSLSIIAPYITQFAKICFAISLFFIGYGLTPSTLKNISVRPAIMAVLLWLMLASVSLILIKNALY